ncbi:hypothetical protein [Flavobacterium sp.]|jgi:hypothetical protein|uniref:hypothetical protein n=1 Tax=Flavobacterium sp. TaxID=239 RepID=UPI0037C0646A
MRNFIIYLTLSLCLLASKLVAQETFESKAKAIAEKITSITNEEKAKLRTEVEGVNLQLEKGNITKEQADDKKKKLAEARAAIIENRIAFVQLELKDLVQKQVDGKIKSFDNKANVYDSVVYYGKKHKIKYTVTDSTYIDVKGISRRLFVNKNIDYEKRTTSQMVLATGFNNLVTNGAVANSDFKYNRSVFFELGISFNTRIFKTNNIFHFKYGLTGVYNGLTASENRYFVDTNGQTTLATYPTELRQRDTYFKNVFVTIPLFLEFDFSKKKFDKNNNRIFKIEEGFRFGIGGFVGYNTNSKQFLSYEENGYRVNERQKGNWNVPDWNYGLSTYVGYKQTSLYLKYDLNPMFKNNIVKQNNISLGIRFDWN